jgi:4-carboxymuconolactone decarboxylase
MKDANRTTAALVAALATAAAAWGTQAQTAAPEVVSAAAATAAAAAATPAAPYPSGALNAREQSGLDVMAQIGWGTNAATRELDPDLWHIINEANFGNIWTRPGLSLRDRELIVMSVLIAIGSSGISHLLENADKVGITDTELKEMILQTIPYSGQPNAIQAIIALKKVQAARKPKP